jgi:hypothetical protein
MISFTSHHSAKMMAHDGTTWLQIQVTPSIEVTVFVSHDEAFQLGRELIQASGKTLMPQGAIEAAIAAAVAEETAPPPPEVDIPF